MRSISFTLVLLLIATAICGVLGWQIREGNLNAILGVPPIQPGSPLYTDFHQNDVGRIMITAHGVRASFKKTDEGWKAVAAPHDRMDPRFAGKIIEFSLHMYVRDFASVDEIDRDKVGLRNDSVEISLETPSGRQLARYRMGDRTPLQTENTETGVSYPSFYIQPRERGRKDYVYACTGDISQLFKDGMKYLRDHHPFSFNPLLLQTVRLRGPEGELTLSHPNPETGWRIVKPLDLRTDPAKVRSLLEGLFELNAIRIADRSSVTLPAAEATARSLQIGLTHFGQQSETTLEVFFPPETPDASEALAIVSNRPDTVFYLPIKAEPGSLANLPVTVNDLRDRSLTTLDVSRLGSITISPITGKPIHITRGQVEINGKAQQPNEQRFVALLKMLTEGRAMGFESDAATDFTPWGLNRPFLVIEVQGGTDGVIRLNFGMDGRGGVFVNRQGTPTVMRIDESLLSAVSIQPYEWRLARFWSVSMVDLKGIERTVRADPTLKLSYDDSYETWKGSINGTDVSDRIDPAKAKRMLESLIGPDVSRWLAPDDEAAAAALAAPAFTLTIIENVVDDFGDDLPEQRRRTLTLAAPLGEPNSRLLFGKVTGEENPFLLDRDTALKIATDPLEK